MDEVTLGDRVNISFTLYGYLKLLTLLEAVTEQLPITEDLLPASHALLDVLRTFPLTRSGSQ